MNCRRFTRSSHHDAATRISDDLVQALGQLLHRSRRTPAGQLWAGMSLLPPSRSRYLAKRTELPHRGERGKSANFWLMHCSRERSTQTLRRRGRAVLARL
jgi:hypothetical protein